MDPKQKLAMTVDYLFGRDISSILPLDRLQFTFSKRTGGLRSVLLDERLLATFRSDGGLALTVLGADLLNKHPKFKENCVVVTSDAEKYVSKGRSVFCKHVVWCGGRVLPGSDVAILNREGRVIAVGKAVLSAKMIKQFKSGVAVKVRQGVDADGFQG